MSNHRMSTPEASKALGIPVHVITYWLGQIPYPAEQDDKGEWRLTPEAMAVLETVRDLKGQNRTMETIRRHVKELQDAPPAPAPAARRPAPGRTQVAVEAAAEPGPAEPPRPPAGNAPAAPPRDAGPPRQAPPKAARPADQGPPPGASRPAEQGPPPAAARPAEPTQRPAERPPEGARPANRPAGANAPAGRKGGPAPAAPQGGPMQPAPAARPPVPAPSTPMPASGHDLASHVARAVTEAVRQETMLAQRYAHAAHQIGKLEAENEHLRAMLTAATTKHGRDLDEARCRIAELEARPAPKPKTSWWAWLTIAVML